jgi:hypothetical protein
MSPQSRAPPQFGTKKSNVGYSPPISDDKENIPTSRLSATSSRPIPPPDPSEPVREFLRSLIPNLEHLLPRFCKLGIEDLETLLAFKAWSRNEREELLVADLNKFQLLAVQNFFRKA